MRKIRYAVAMSLDGYIAGPNDEADWIPLDPEVNFGELWAQFDTLLMGRRTYEAAIARLGKWSMQGLKTFVVSRTLRQADHPDVTILSELGRDCLAQTERQRRLADGRGQPLSSSAGDARGGHRRGKHRAGIIGGRCRASAPSPTTIQIEIVQPQSLSVRAGVFDLSSAALSAQKSYLTRPKIRFLRKRLAYPRPFTRS
jgi:hypothetical protein